MTSPVLSAILDEAFADPVLRQRIDAEAAFGYREIQEALEALPDGARVLEIGCGTGVLLAELVRMHPQLSFAGVEPIGSGFSPFAAVLDRIEASHPGLEIHRGRIEDMQEDRGQVPFDLIFSVNVFEHLDDWRRGLDAAMALLAPGGRHVILCPNHALPYESHFNIPLIGGPGLSRRLFARRIARIEAENDAEGLWASLNFIASGELARHCGARGHEIRFDTGIMGRMLARLDADADFAKRQSSLGGVARLLDRVGIARLFKALPAGASPYLRAEIRQRSNQSISGSE